MTRSLTCILCPRGCTLTAEITGEAVQITGNSCPKGAEYGKTECLHPVRTVTATVRVTNRPDTMVSVKTEAPVPKEEMHAVMALVRKLQVNAPVEIGAILAEDIFGTRLIVTKSVP